MPTMPFIPGLETRNIAMLLRLEIPYRQIIVITVGTDQRTGRFADCRSIFNQDAGSELGQ